MSSTRAQRLALEGAERRVLEELRAVVERRSSARRAAVLVGATVLFAAAFAARLAINDPGALIANFYVVPIALLAIEFGTRAGIVAAAVAMGLVFAWRVINTVDVSTLGYTARGAVFLITGTVVGEFSERLRRDIAERQRVQRQLSLYANELEHTHRQLAESVERLEAFAEIARGVGGETDLERVLALILEHCHEIVAARLYVVWLLEGDRLIALTSDGEAVPLHGSLPGDVLLSGRPQRVALDDQFERLAPGARAAILVPLSFRGESLGVLAGIDRDGAEAFDQDDEQLLLSVAASAATAVATARSVAAARLRVSLEAAEQSRARWARELHDETLQAISGVRMVLSAGLAREDPAALRIAAHNADAHLAEEIRNLRGLIAELRPAALDDLGLGPAIETLARRQAAVGGFTVELAVALDPDRRPTPEAEGAIYRIVQEALSNVVKHADAQHVLVQLRQDLTCIEIAVRDDGRGFSTDRASAGFGLTGMRERAMLADGRLSIDSAPGGPTCVTALLPVTPTGVARETPATS